jgi:hypothetical protein
VKRERAVTRAEIVQINPTLDNAISHDIAANGQAIAEIMDANLGGTDGEDACRLLLAASLANVPNGVVGLSLSEVISYLCTPGRDLSRLPKDVLGVLATKAWYLHSSREGKLYFKNVQNLVAKLKTTAEAYNRESSKKELRDFLDGVFVPAMKDCYQLVQALPAVDAIDIKSEKVTMLVTEPYAAGGLNPDLQKYYADLTFKNRILFLSGQRDTMEGLLETAAEMKAIGHIIAEMEAEKVPDNDPQMVAAKDMHDKIRFRLLSTARETFTTLGFPQGEKLATADFLMNFTDNNYNGEKQIRDALKGKQKSQSCTRTNNGELIMRPMLTASSPATLLRIFGSSSLRLAMAPFQRFGDRAVPRRQAAQRSDAHGCRTGGRTNHDALPARPVLDSPFSKTSTRPESGAGAIGDACSGGGLRFQSPADARVHRMDRRASLPVFATARPPAGLVRVSRSTGATNHAGLGVSHRLRIPT